LKEQLESKGKQIQELIQSVVDLKNKDDIINNLTAHKECKTDSTNDNLQKELDAMKAKFKALKIEHESDSI
jgi:L-fucose mutarotase/ribose pyranase (RbsD/FucU family)